jgi:hypothetical protein
MSAKHTPGPWHVGGIGVVRDAVVYSADKFAVCNCIVYHRHHGGEEEMRANARLIAAAPELLSFAKEAAEVLDYYAQFKYANGKPDPAIVSLINQAEAVIAKAEGGS